MSPPKVLMWPLGKLRKSRRNARAHAKKQIRQIADSILTFKWTVPILVDEDGTIIAGHARYEAAMLLGLREVPVIVLSGLSDAQKRAYMLADNKIAANASWDRSLLAVELGELSVLLPQVDLELETTGFDVAEIDSILTDFVDNEASPSDEVPDLRGAQVVSRRGDKLALGRHRLFVGDAQKQENFTCLMGGELAAMAFLDPPYNRPPTAIGGRGRVKHGGFAYASGEMSPDEFVGFLTTTLGLCARHSVDGAIHYVCMDWRHIEELLVAGKATYDQLKNVCVWSKTTPGQGSFYRSQHEFVFVYKYGQASHLNNFELGQHGRMRSNIWTYAGVNTFRAGRMDELRMHPTVKPVAMIADAMRDCSRRGAIILDTFAGSGSTIMAAEQVGRRAFCMEIDPHYADVTIRRWQAFTKRDAVLEGTGQTFDELADLRARSDGSEGHGNPAVAARDAAAEPSASRRPRTSAKRSGAGQKRVRRARKRQPPRAPSRPHGRRS